MAKPRIAVFSGPTATICNSPPPLTSAKARRLHGLPPLRGAAGRAARFDRLHPQRLAAPVTVYIEAFTAHPLEADAAGLYAPPDGWLDTAGAFHRERPAAGGTPVHVAELRPEDGLYPLPYMARQRDGSAWEEAGSHPSSGAAATRQTYYPHAGRIYEEIDRLGIGSDGREVPLSALADFDFFRAAPSGGYTAGLPAAERTDTGGGAVPPEVPGADFFGYAPHRLAREPGGGTLATATNTVARVLAEGRYDGAQWLEGSPTVEETLYWLGLLVDTTVPLVGHAAQRPRLTLGADGDRNIVDGVRYLASGVALDPDGRDRAGPLLIVDELGYAAREAAKVDARPGGYTATGGHGGVLADLGGAGPPRLGYLPTHRFTHRSRVRMSELPEKVPGVYGSLAGGVHTVPVATRTPDGLLVPEAMPTVTLTKYVRWSGEPVPADTDADAGPEVEILARIGANLAGAPLAGFVAEGNAPFGAVAPSTRRALLLAVFAGMPVVAVGRGNTGGRAWDGEPLFLSGANLTATKARMLLMAALLRFGALPPAADPAHPTPHETAAVHRALAAYQDVFDTH